jgi:hypothetical protein
VYITPSTPPPKGGHHGSLHTTVMKLTLELELWVHFETDKAFLVSEDNENDNGVWLPKSQIDWVEDAQQRRKGYRTTFYVPMWLCEKKGLV